MHQMMKNEVLAFDTELLFWYFIFTYWAGRETRVHLRGEVPRFFIAIVDICYADNFKNHLKQICLLFYGIMPDSQ